MIETLVWIAITLVVGILGWIAEPYHTRLIDAVHGRAAEKELDESFGLHGVLRPIKFDRTGSHWRTTARF